jgi:hypothetical protein
MIADESDRIPLPPDRVDGAGRPLVVSETETHSIHSPVLTAPA